MNPSQGHKRLRLILPKAYTSLSRILSLRMTGSLG